jgi:N-acyl-D-aspartate/D-glutamate deacylase
MAFYNMGLRLLRHVQDAEKAGKPFMTAEPAVHRLTGELADWYRIDAGHLRMVNRNDATVKAVFVSGRAVFLDGKATDLVGKRRTGRFLRAAHRAPALTFSETEFASVG